MTPPDSGIAFNSVLKWKLTFWRLFAFGVGIGCAILLAAGTYVWLQTRPEPPKPWDTESITATFDSVLTEGDQNTWVFYYSISNNTDRDYRLDATSAAYMSKARGNTLSNASPDFETFDTPIYIPSKHRLRFAVHVKFPYDIKDPLDDEAAHAVWKKQFLEFVRKEARNLNGWVLFDETNRYEIILRRGW
jgi:hypothetical protein